MLNMAVHIVVTSYVFKVTHCLLNRNWHFESPSQPEGTYREAACVTLSQWYRTQITHLGTDRCTTQSLTTVYTRAVNVYRLFIQRGVTSPCDVLCCQQDMGDVKLNVLLARCRSHAREASSSSASQQIPRILWNPQVNYRFLNSSSLLHILSQISPVHALHALQPHFFEIRFNITPHLRLGLPSCLFPSDFSIRAFRAFHFSPIRATCHANLILTIFGWQLKRDVWCLLIDLQVLHTHCLLVLLHPEDGGIMLPRNVGDYRRVNLKYHCDNMKCCKGKGKGLPITGHEGPERSRGIALLFL